LGDTFETGSISGGCTDDSCDNKFSYLDSRGPFIFEPWMLDIRFYDPLTCMIFDDGDQRVEAYNSACNSQDHHFLCQYNCDGAWSLWSPWTSCNATCGLDATKSRFRNCTAPVPANGGAACNGSDIDVQSCNYSLCVIDGVWSSWSNWSVCPVTCGGSIITRNRTCDNPVPQNGGLNCSGNATDLQACSTTACPGMAK
jgi:hypothetical protein